MRLLLGSTLVLSVWLLAYIRGRRKHERTNQAGVEQYRSYGHKLRAQALDRLLSWLMWAFLVAGALLII